METGRRDGKRLPSNGRLGQLLKQCPLRAPDSETPIGEPQGSPPRPIADHEACSPLISAKPRTLSLPTQRLLIIPENFIPPTALYLGSKYLGTRRVHVILHITYGYRLKNLTIELSCLLRIKLVQQPQPVFETSLSVSLRI